MERIENVAAYIRVSTQEQKIHGISLAAQEQKLRSYAESHNMRIVGWYKDEGVSGRKLIKNRPELQRMIIDAEQGKFSRIIFITLDRFFRSVSEYHACMNRIAPVIWTATEEKFDLSTAQGRMLVNMKLTIAELEADTTGERIDRVNEYKMSTGQPLTGSMPFGFKIAPGENGRKKIIKDPEVADILEDALQYFFTHQSKKKTLIYLHTKHHISINYSSLTNLLKNTMLYGAYRDNPNYCEAYMDKETFDKLQDIMKRNVKNNTANKRTYIFSGLVRCPECGRVMSGGWQIAKKKSGKVYHYKKYRCPGARLNNVCSFNKPVSENVLEKLMLENIEHLFEGVKIEGIQVTDSGAVSVPETSVEEIHEQIDRLNYSWQTSKIRTVEQYEKQYNELLQKLEEAEAEQGEVEIKDFSKIEEILHDGWKAIYENLDDTYKRAFWRSFVKSIEVKWTTDEKKIARVKFF